MLYISLGSNCYVSWTLRKIGLQQKSYPLDWVNSSSVASISYILANGFTQVIPSWQKSDFVDDVNLGFNNNKYLVKHLSLRFPHEYDVNPEIDLQDIVIRYERRMARLALDVSLNRVIFIRNVEIGYGGYPAEDPIVYKENEEKLYNSLVSICGHTNFVVFLFSRSVNFDYEPTNQNFFLIKKSIPFENGFYKFNSDYLVGDVIFNFYKNFFNEFENLFSCNVLPSVEMVQRLYTDSQRSVVDFFE